MCIVGGGFTGLWAATSSGGPHPELELQLYSTGAWLDTVSHAAAQSSTIRRS